MKKLSIEVSEELRQAWPRFRGSAVFAVVKNTAHNDALWKKIEDYTELYRSRYTTESIKAMPPIQATRAAYKKCGKDPSRYRPSSEALCRRILRGIPLYRIDTLVDAVNLASIWCGHSISGFDLDKIEGDSLVLGIGKPGEPYEGIGRGVLNIEGMPVCRDAAGGIGTPTSDNERTKMGLETTHILAVISAYSGGDGLDEATDYLVGLLREYADAEEVETVRFQ